jgi:hypothetical protein
MRRFGSTRSNSAIYATNASPIGIGGGSMMSRLNLRLESLLRFPSIAPKPCDRRSDETEISSAALEHISIGVGDPVHLVADIPDSGVGPMSACLLHYLVTAAASQRGRRADWLRFIVWPRVSTTRCVTSISSWWPVSADANARITTLTFSPAHPLMGASTPFMPHGVGGHNHGDRKCHELYGKAPFPSG